MWVFKYNVETALQKWAETGKNQKFLKALKATPAEAYNKCGKLD